MKHYKPTYEEWVIEKKNLSISEGGNVRALNRETGEEFLQAQKIELNIFNRKKLVKEFKETFSKINKLYKKMWKTPLWDDFSVVTSGFAFNGSSDAFFNDDISDEDFLKYKPNVGDIDITIPKERLHNLFTLLTTLEHKNITSNVKYIGQNKKDLKALGAKDQINSIFLYSEGKFENAVQVDFEATEYTADFVPSEWGKFGHSSDWEDIKKGFKGVNHKYILLNATRAISKRGDVMLATPASPISRDKPIKLKKVKPGDVPRMYAFSVAKGVRVKLVQQFYEDGEPAMVDGKFIFKEAPTSESTYSRTVNEIYKIIFSREPSGDDLEKMRSFVGVISLMKKYFTKSEVKDTFEYMLMLNLFGPAAQALEVNNPQLDFKIKWPMIEEMFKEFPYLKKQKKRVLKMADEYIKEYKYRTISI